MKLAHPNHTDTLDGIPLVPGWITGARAQNPEDVAFFSGAVLAVLDFIVRREDVPQPLLKERLALRAAEACVAFSGRSERAGALRDEVHLLRPGETPGPAGTVYLAWRRAIERPVSVKALRRALPGSQPDQIATWLDVGRGGPVARAAAVLEAVSADRLRDEMTALIVADAVLARAAGWDHVVPLLATGLKTRDLHKTGDALRLACHRALKAAAADAVPMAADLARRVVRLRAVVPKLRAKGAGEAVDIFLSRDAVMPAALPLSDRAARRLCDRLVDLGAVRELTGRDTFRLYGL